jgi:hypothetical protein
MMSGGSTNLSNGSAHWATSDQRWRLQYRQLQRVQNKLEEFLSPQDARETIMSIYDLVLEIDQELDRILMDRLVQSSYEYDGQFFTPKCSWGFHRAFDGIHVLESLSEERLQTFFRVQEKGLAIRWLMNELEKHTWEAKIRRINWEEFQTLSVVPKQVLDEIVRDIREQKRQAAEVSALSPEEVSFFKPLEEQMAQDYRAESHF